MSEFQVRIAVHVRDLAVRPKEWRDEHVRVNVTAARADEAVRLVEAAIARLVDRDSQRRISIIPEEEKGHG